MPEPAPGPRGPRVRRTRLMMSVLLEILAILFLLIANGVFAMSETAVIAARKARLQQRAEEGDVKAAEALKLASDPNQFLSTVQIGITLVGIFAGAFGGATLAEKLSVSLRAVPALRPYSDTLALVLVVLAITYLSLVIGELVPKRLALINPERVAASVAAPMRLLSVAAAPAVKVLTLSTDGILRLAGIRPSQEPPVTEEEIRVLIDQGTEAGVFEEAEQDIVESVFELGDLRVRQLMTHRVDVEWLNIEDPPEKNQEKLLSGAYSRYPVGEGSVDRIVGVVHAKHLMRGCLVRGSLDLREAVRPPVFIPESVRALRLLALFKECRQEIALVVDEHGGLEGLVTLTDILESIVGRMPSAEREDEPPVVRREDGSWLVDGMLPVSEVKDLLDLRALPGEEEGLYETLGGFLTTYLGQIPASGTHFEFEDIRFEVIDMDGHRVDKVLVSRGGPG
jgi:putative hemolysin